jgi:hypothetical protein
LILKARGIHAATELELFIVWHSAVRIMLMAEEDGIFKML